MNSVVLLPLLHTMPRRSSILLAAAFLTLSGCRGGLPDLVIPAGEQPTRWAPAIAAFAAEDSAVPPEPGKVVFVGSSSIRLWDSLAADMAPMPVVHRGFGGAKLFDAIYYSERLVSVHQPSVVVVFCGTNDIAGERPKSAHHVRDLFRQFVARLRWFDHDLTICHIAITPTLARREHLEIVARANQLIRTDCEADPKLEFVDPSVDLMDGSGRPDAKWFRQDRLHLNDAGYAVWTRHIRPVVERLYRREAGE